MSDLALSVGVFAYLTDSVLSLNLPPNPRGLDNAGKTTIVKQTMGEDVNEVSPTLGFNIKTLFYNGYSLHICGYLHFLHTCVRSS